MVVTTATWVTQGGGMCAVAWGCRGTNENGKAFGLPAGISVAVLAGHNDHLHKVNRDGYISNIPRSGEPCFKVTPLILCIFVIIICCNYYKKTSLLLFIVLISYWFCFYYSLLFLLCVSECIPCANLINFNKNNSLVEIGRNLVLLYGSFVTENLE